MASDPLSVSENTKRLDKVTRKVAGMIDDYVNKKIKELNKGGKGQPDFRFEQKQAAVPVSLAIKTLWYGAERVAFRAVPRAAIDYLETLGEELVGSVFTFAGGKTLLKKIPLAGDILALLIRLKKESDYFARLEKMIRENLGPESNENENAPMRFSINKHVELMKYRVAKEVRRVDPVHTRNPEGRGK